MNNYAIKLTLKQKHSFKSYKAADTPPNKLTKETHNNPLLGLEVKDQNFQFHIFFSFLMKTFYCLKWDLI